MAIDKLEAMMPHLLEENIKQLEGLPLTEQEVQHNFGLAKLVVYEAVLIHAISFSDCLKDGDIVPFHDVLEKLGVSKH